jgi:glucose/arabinose dehydrogenase
MMNKIRVRTTALAAAIAGVLLIAFAVSSSLGAPSDGLKHPPTSKLKDFEIETVAQGFNEPESVDWLPDGTMLVSQREGSLIEVTTDGVKKKILDISGHVANQRERGFGTVEVAADFATSHVVYISYTYLVNPKDPGGPQAQRLSAITLNPDGSVANPDNPERVILGKDAKAPCPPIANRLDCPASIDSTHQAGNVISDPKDNTLWVSYGDSNLPSNPGKQDFRVYNDASTSGKILHVDRNGNGLPGHSFCRFNHDVTDTCTKIYARGFRNPYRFSLSNEDTPIVSDVGWNEREEISRVEQGKNYGWPCYEGNIKTPFYKEFGTCKKIYAQKKKQKIRGPFLAYKHPKRGAGAAVIVGPIYNHGLYPPAFNGTAFYGDYAQGFLKRLVYKKGKGFRSQEVATGVTPVDITLAPDGNIAFVDYRRGSIRELVYSPSNKAPVPQMSATPGSGLAPLNVQFSSAGTVDPDHDAISYDWDFGDGSPHSTDPNPSHVYTTDGSYIAKLVVSDGKANGTATVRTTITVGNNAPTATILLPTPGSFSLGGQPTPLKADGSDIEDGSLPDSAFNWNVILHHGGHVHPEGLTTGRNSSFTAVRDHDADSYYEVILTVTDSQGLSTTLPSVIVRPSITPLRIGSNLKGIKISYGGREVKVPTRFKAAIGFFANLSAPATVKRKGKTYKFDHWTQGGKRNQIYEIPVHASRVRAIYK